ncbi:hypothetical protein HHX47_DHR7000388 [Lentinula edodes]|nr:hypothetical protein HHX47_DHR7000388 [Lentinula edodes]
MSPISGTNNLRWKTSKFTSFNLEYFSNFSTVLIQVYLDDYV